MVKIFGKFLYIKCVGFFVKNIDSVMIYVSDENVFFFVNYVGLGLLQNLWVENIKIIGYEFQYGYEEVWGFFFRINKILFV